MHGKTRNALLGYGLVTDLINKIAKCEHTIEVLRALSRKELRKHYTEQETEKIKSQLERQPIPDATIQAIIQKSGTAGCYCSDGKLGEFDTKSSSWLRTPAEIRELGGAIYGDRRYNRVFIGHNGAESYYSGRGFRGSLKV